MILDEHLWRQETYDNQAEEYRELRRRGLARLAADNGE
jgi:hypothetical protein